MTLKPFTKLKTFEFNVSGISNILFRVPNTLRKIIHHGEHVNLHLEVDNPIQKISSNITYLKYTKYARLIEW